MASLSKSVPKIWTGKCCFDLSMPSCKIMASEYASSPDAQPAAHTRTGALSGCAASNFGTTVFASASKASASRKKFVTPMSSSLNSKSSSCGFSDNSRRYCSGP